MGVSCPHEEGATISLPSSETESGGICESPSISFSHTKDPRRIPRVNYFLFWEVFVFICFFSGASYTVLGERRVSSRTARSLLATRVRWEFWEGFCLLKRLEEGTNWTKCSVAQAV